MSIEVGKYYKGNDCMTDYYQHIAREDDGNFFGQCLAIEKCCNEIKWEGAEAFIEEDYCMKEISLEEFNAARELARSMI